MVDLLHIIVFVLYLLPYSYSVFRSNLFALLTKKVNQLFRNNHQNPDPSVSIISNHDFSLFWSQTVKIKNTLINLVVCSLYLF